MLLDSEHQRVYNERQDSVFETNPIAGNPAAAIIACAVAGLCNGSFAVPMKQIKTWRWEHIWLVYSVLAYGILPLALALALAHRIVIEVLPGSGPMALQVAFFGTLWGSGAVLFGLSLLRLGIAVGNALISSVIVLVGSVGPLLIGAAEMSRRALLEFLLGLAPLIAGIVLCAAASVKRDAAKAFTGEKTRARSQSAVGILMAMVAGILSSMLNIGFASGSALAEQAQLQGYPPQLAALAIWVPALAGGLMVNLSYTGWLIQRADSWRTLYSTGSARSSWLPCFIMAALWFGAILLYGYGATAMGPTGAVYGWAMTVGSSILASNIWGAATGEWRGAGSIPKVLMAAASVLFITSFVILATQPRETKIKKEMHPLSAVEDRAEQE
jgi:L-rhamnose-H+ transport protein